MSCGDRLGVGEAELLDRAGVVLVDDLLGEEALDHRAALAADEVEMDGLALRMHQVVGGLAGGADDVGVERAGEAAVGGADDEQVVSGRAGAGEQRGLCGPITTLEARLAITASMRSA
jgi:hypothetical protein